MNTIFIAISICVCLLAILIKHTVARRKSDLYESRQNEKEHIDSFSNRKEKNTSDLKLMKNKKVDTKENQMAKVINFEERKREKGMDVSKSCKKRVP